MYSYSANIVVEALTAADLDTRVETLDPRKVESGLRRTPIVGRCKTIWS